MESGRGNPLEFQYDALHRLTNMTYAVNDAERFAYDAVGNLTNYTARDGARIRFLYDPANRLTNKTYTGSSVFYAFAYDAADRLTNATRQSGTTVHSRVAFHYDSAGRLTNETQIVSTATARAVRYEYDAAGRKTKMIYPDNTFITYEYNANGGLTAIKDGGTTTIVGYEYDNAGRRKKRTLENSTVTEYGYDAADQMTSIVHKKTDLTPISSFEYGYDDAGQRVWVKRGNGKGDVYKYDATDQLTNVLYEATNPDTSPSAWTNEARYAFDAAGNRTSVTVTNSSTNSYTANALNQYEQIGDDIYPSYDANGNLWNDGTAPWSSSFDRENRLVASETLSETLWYQYDPFNRLVERIKDGSQTTRFYYDDQWRLVAEYDGSTNLLAKYVYGPEIDEPVRMLRNNEYFYYHAAALGTVTEITDPSGDLVERYQYDVYGEPTIYDSTFNPQPSTAIGNRLLFQGRDRDPATGLYNFRNRYYSPGFGRFVQVDPIRERGGMNLYVFAHNSPDEFTDPDGLFKWDPSCNAVKEQIKARLAQACKKAKDSDCYNKCKIGKQGGEAIDKACNSKDGEGPPVKCETTHQRCQTTARGTGCGWTDPRGDRTIHVCIGKSSDSCPGGEGCTLFHELAHREGGVGRDDVVLDPDNRAYELERCAGCRKPQ